jgi:flagellar biosynthesis/type III secretory pathway M-ring protein FliF/YscJ
MEFLKLQFERARQQWNQLAPSQRMLAASLLVIMVMTMMWWGSLAGKSELEVLLDQPMSAQELGAIRDRLTTIGIPSRVVGDRIHVAADRRLDALADLTVSHLMPADTRNAFDELAARSNPFWSSRQHDQAQLQAKQAVLAQVIRRFPPVAHATVVIDPTRERGMGGTQPSATVSMNFRSGERAEAKWADGAADLLTGAVAGLDRSRIKVLINGVSQRIRAAGEESLAGDSGEIRMALQQKAEQHFVSKLQGQFGFIEGAMFSVAVKLELGHKRMREHRVDPKSTVQKPVRDKTSTEETQSGRSGGGEPGMALNQPLSVSSAAGAAGEAQKGTSEVTETDFLVDMNKSDIESFDPGGESAVTHASMLVPRSHFVRTYQRETNTAEKAPDETILADFIKNRLERWKPHVRAVTGMAKDAEVNLDVYTDLMPEAVMAAPATAGLAMSLVSAHGKEIALGVLALLSLFMVSNIVKKSGPVPALATAGAAVGPAANAVLTPKSPLALVAGEEVVGEVRAGDALLEGMEVDTEAVRSQEMLKQVEELVGEDPDAAAALVKRWLSK